MNIVLIIADTFRRDHLGVYGNKRIHTPHLDALAEKSIVFDRAYASSFPTMPNRADVMTGKHTFTYMGWSPLSESEKTLPQTMSEGGYLTTAVIDTPFYIRNGYGYDRGYDDFIWLRGQNYTGPEHKDIRADCTSEEGYFAPATFREAELWLEKHYKDNFFLHVETWDPHEPWQAPSHYIERYRKDFDGSEAPWPAYWWYEERGFTREDVDKAHDYYCGEITMVDRCIGRLIERLDSLGILDDTAILFTSDHGYYFGEHGMFGKAAQKDDNGIPYPESTFTSKWYRAPVLDELSRVPMMIKVPGLTPGRREAIVSHPDIMPTLLELAGIAVPDTVEGESLLPLMKGEKDNHRDFCITSWPLHNPGESVKSVDSVSRRIAEPLASSVTDGKWTLLYAIEGEPVELYHNETDPGQTNNIFDENREEAERLHRWFVEFLKKSGTKEHLLNPRLKI